MQTGAPADRLGVALSGGGHRAALFHLGVFARMAELGLLSQVEAISTVSGGSIVGALYYLHVKRLLEEVPDEQITDTHFVELVDRVERGYLAAVQKNVRGRSVIDPGTLLRSAWPHYSRSDRLGELYDLLFFRPAWATPRSTPIEMRELLIQPAGHAGEFHPVADNAARRNKVPMLEINATTLNTGRNWLFSATRLGEPPADDEVSQEIDKKTRLRRPVRYDRVCDHVARIPLGIAVAASAAVPALFPPLAISHLYPDPYFVQLIDGGAHDNQGVGALLRRGCTRIVASDASGQLTSVGRPGTGMLEVFGRTTELALDQIRDLSLRNRMSGADGVKTVVLHLRKGLTADAVSWLDARGQLAEANRNERTGRPSESFGVDQRVQTACANVRTDLDAFSDVEAFTLMCDGYAMAGAELPGSEAVGDRVTGAASQWRWRFLDVAPWMRSPTPEYLRRMEVASELMLKYFRLSAAARAVALGVLAVAAAVLLAVLLPALWRTRDAQVHVSSLWLLLGLLVVPPLVVRLLLAGPPLVHRLGRMLGIGLALPLRLLAALPVSIYSILGLRVIDPGFLRLGRLSALTPPPGKSGPQSPAG